MRNVTSAFPPNCSRIAESFLLTTSGALASVHASFAETSCPPQHRTPNSKPAQMNDRRTFPSLFPRRRVRRTGTDAAKCVIELQALSDSCFVPLRLREGAGGTPAAFRYLERGPRPGASELNG